MVYPLERICVHLIRRLDVDETLRAVDYLRYGFKLSTDLVERDGRVYWTAKYLDTPEDRAVMDVTEMGFHRLPFSRLNLYNQVTSARVVGSRLHLEGAVVNQLGRLDPPGDLSLSVSLRNRGRPTRRTHRVDDWTLSGDRLHYRTVVDLARAVGALDAQVPFWDVRLEISKDGGDERHAVHASTRRWCRVIPIRVRGRLGGVAPGYLEPFVTPEAEPRLPAGRRHGRDPGGRAGEPVRDPGAGSRCGGGRAGRWATTQALKALAYKVFRRLPVQHGLVVFESHMGRQYSDSPRYIYEAAVDAGLDRLGLDPVWSYAPAHRRVPHRRTAGAPGQLALPTSTWRGPSSGSTTRASRGVFSRRRETTYIQTWHGTPLKRMGFDSPGPGAGQRLRSGACTRR